MTLCLTAGLIALQMRTKANSITNQMTETFSGFFSVTPDLDVPGASNRLTDQFCENILKQVDNIKTYNGKDMFLLSVPDLHLIEGKYTGVDEERASITKFVVNSSSEYGEQFSLGELLLLEGEHLVPSDKGKVLISESLATQNDLNVGDYIQGIVNQSCLGPNQDAIGEAFPFQIKGIYKVKYPADNYSDIMESEIAENCIFVDAATGKSVISMLRGEKMNWYRQGITFIVKNTDQIEDTLKEVKITGDLDDDAYQIDLNKGKYEKTAAPFHSLIKSVDIFLIILVIAAGITMSIILLLYLRSRKHEIAIYLSIGIEKREVCFQLLLENIFVFLLSYLTASFLSFFLNTFMNNYLFTSEYNLASEIGIDLRPFFETLAGGFLVILVSIAVPTVLIVRSKPLDILYQNQ